MYSSSLNDYIDVHVKRLLKNLLKKQEFHKINPLVDLYNLISMDTKLALGAHDLDKIEGNITLRLTQGNENYIPLGSEEAKEVKADIYSYIDDANDIICYSEIRQVDKTKVTNESKDIFFIVQGNKETSDKYVKDIAKELYYSLYSIQHRGQESCEMAISNGNNINYKKDMGLVGDVFKES